jgi:16S rRNA (cytosine967-C5)-methyltransferase
MRSHSYINSARSIIAQYDGSMPLSAWLKNFFRGEKKFGSRDRKLVTHLCYCYYRLGKAFVETGTEERILLGTWLCSQSSNLVLSELKPQWNERVHLSLEEKLEELHALPELNSLFPFREELSPLIDAEAFIRSLLVQPDLFLRIRPGKIEVVIKKLEEAQTAYALHNETLTLPNGTKIEDVLRLDEEAVVQDAQSQQVLRQLRSVVRTDGPLTLWDCCAASGGKSILAYDQFSSLQLTVSDVRASILSNLRKRFERAGIRHYAAFVADITSPGFRLNKTFDIVLCDAPCSGSGTWSRTPEQLSFFRPEQIMQYAELQKKISARASRYVRKSGYFLYITCSVFREENEEVVAYLEQEGLLQLHTMEYLKGYEGKADTLFVALFSVL